MCFYRAENENSFNHNLTALLQSGQKAAQPSNAHYADLYKTPALGLRE